MSYIIGICGGSGSGKTTLAELLQKSLGEDSCSLLSLDNYYFDFVQQGIDPATVNYDHPDSFEFDLLYRNLRDLRSGEATQIPQYDFSNHTRKEELLSFGAKKYIILEGLFLYTLPEVNAVFNLRFFIDLPETKRYARRKFRDLNERDRSIQFIEKQYNEFVLPMHNRFVETNSAMANQILDGNETPAYLLNSVLLKMKRHKLV